MKNEPNKFFTLGQKCSFEGFDNEKARNYVRPIIQKETQGILNKKEKEETHINLWECFWQGFNSVQQNNAAN